MQGPDFRPLPPPSPAAFAAQVDTPRADPGPGEPAQRVVAAAPASDWWRAFGSAEIDARVGEALAQNQDIAAARARLARAREAAIQAGAGLYPALDAGASVTRLTSSFLPQGIDQRGSLTNDYLIGPSVRYAVDVFGGQRRLREQRGAQAEAARFELDLARLAVGAAVVRTAIEGARIRAQLEVLDDVLKADRETVAGVERLVEVRRKTVADLAAARSQLAQDQALAPPLRQQLAANTTALAVLTGRTPDQAPPSALSLAAMTVPRDLPMTVPAELVRRRPDVRAAESQLHAANAAIGVAAARQLPALTLTGSITQEALSASRLFSSAATGGFVAANLTAPVFHAGELRSQKREAIAVYDEAAARYRQTVLGAVGQVADVLQALDHDAEAVAAEAAAVAAAERALEAAQTRYAAAQTDLLQVLKARQDLGRARLRQVAARSQRLLDTVQLHAALGGGGV